MNTAVAPSGTAPHEHEFEAVHGLPEALPANEHLLWQGHPDPVLLARRVFHMDLLLIYFGVLMAWRGLGAWHDGADAAAALWSTVTILPLALLALSLLGATAWFMASSTVYSITDRRVVMRVGVVLSVTFNLPFTRIAAADLRRQGEGTGDIALTLHADDRIGYGHLWPHVRPWHLRNPQPMLRALPDAEQATEILARAYRAAEQAAQPGREQP